MRPHNQYNIQSLSECIKNTAEEKHCFACAVLPYTVSCSGGLSEGVGVQRKQQHTNTTQNTITQENQVALLASCLSKGRPFPFWAAGVYRTTPLDDSCEQKDKVGDHKLAAAMQFLPLQHTAQWSLLLLFICTLPTAVHSIDAADLPPCWTPCAFGYSGVEIVPGMGCSLYQNCHEGVVKNRVQCGDGLLYNVKTDYCDHKWNVDCDNEPTCPPTLSPSESPTDSPTGEFVY